MRGRTRSGNAGLVDQICALRAAANAPVFHLVDHAQTLRLGSGFVNRLVTVSGDRDDRLCAMTSPLERHDQGPLAQNLDGGSCGIRLIDKPHVVQQMGGEGRDARDMRDHQFVCAAALPFLMKKCEPSAAAGKEVPRYTTIFFHVNCLHILALEHS